MVFSPQPRRSASRSRRDTSLSSRRKRSATAPVLLAGATRKRAAPRSTAGPTSHGRRIESDVPQIRHRADTRDGADAAHGGRGRRPAALRAGPGAARAPAAGVPLVPGGRGAAHAAAAQHRGRGGARGAQLPRAHRLRHPRRTLRRQTAGVSPDGVRLLRELRDRAQRGGVVHRRDRHAAAPLHRMGPVGRRRGRHGGAECGDVLARAARAARPLARRRPRDLLAYAAGSPRHRSAGRRALPRARGRVRRRRGVPAVGDHLATMAHPDAVRPDRTGTDRPLGCRLAAGGRRALRAAASAATAVSRLRRRVPGGAGRRGREPRPGWPGGLRGGAAAALPESCGRLGPARRPGRVSSRLLHPAAPARRRVAGRARAGAATGASGPRGSGARPLAAGSAGALGNLLPLRHRAPRLRRDARREGSPRVAGGRTPARRRRGVALRREHRRRRPVAPRARPPAPAGRRMGGHRHAPARGRGGVAGEGVRLRGSHPPRRRAGGSAALPAAVLPPRLAPPRAVHRRVSVRDRLRPARHQLAADLLAQAPRVLARALVAVRAAGTGAALAAGDGGCNGTARRLRRLATPASCHRRAAPADDGRPRSSLHDRGAIAARVGVPGVARRQVLPVRPGAHRVPHVCHRGSELGRARRPDRTAGGGEAPHLAVPGAERPPQRLDRLLRGRSGPPAGLSRPRAPPAQARRGSARRPAHVHPRGWSPQGRAPGAPSRAARRPALRSGAGCGRGRVADRPGSRVGRVAGPEADPREGLLAGLLRSRLPATDARRRGARRPREPGRLREPDARSGARGAVVRPHALPARHSRGDHGLPLRRAAPVGKGGGLPLVRPGDGAALGIRGSRAGAPLEPPRRAAVPSRRGLLQLPGPAAVQGEVRSGVAAALPGLARRGRPAARAGQRGVAGVRRPGRDRRAMTRRRVAVLMILLWCRSVAGATGESLDYDPIGRIAISRPTVTPRAVAVLLTGDDGFTAPEAAIASALAAAGALVLGVDLRQYRASLARSWASEVYPSADLELLSQFAQRAFGLPSYEPPVIVGIGAGAALAYASLAQANPNAFRGAVSVSFCPLLALPRPPGRGRGLDASPGDDGTFRLAPSPVVQGRWVVVQPEDDHTCPRALVREFVQRVARAKLIVAPDGTSALASRVRAAFLGIAGASGEDERAARATDVADLPLVELRATGAPTGTLAVMLSGDGGWASIDRDIGGQLAARGVDVVGLNSLRYFWTRRTPESAAADLDRILRHYLAAWDRQRVLLLGYSRGADVLPFLAARLAPDLRSRVALIALLGPGRNVDFEFHLSDWVADADRGSELPIRPEVEKLRGLKILCVYGQDETDSLCPELGPAQAIVLEQPGGHHFGGDYDDIVTRILAAARE